MDRLDDLFPAHISTIAARHDRALVAAALDGVVIHAGSLRYRFLDDNPYPFEPNPHFLNWAPLTAHPESWVVYRSGETPRLIVVLPDDYWHLPPSPPAGAWTEAFDLVVVADADAAGRALPAEKGGMAFIGEDEALARSLGFASVNPERLLNGLHYHRAVKTPYELACMREASALGVRAHRAAEAAFRAGESEYAIHLAYLEAIGFTDSELPYGNIIALNEHGAVLHYQVFDREPPAVSRSFLIDAGARFRGYACDVTRTYARDAGAFADLVAEMDERQRRLVDGCRAGTDYASLHLSAHQHVAELLLEAGLATGATVEALIADGVTRAFFPHGLGHLLGLQVHDIGGLAGDERGSIIDRPAGHPYLRLTRTLEPGMVTTIEPGLYIIDPLLEALRAGDGGKHVSWDTVEAFRPFGGIRIEDDVAVTDGEPENLTRDAFAALAGY